VPARARVARFMAGYSGVTRDTYAIDLRPDGQVANRPVYAAIGVTLEGHKDIWGLWAGARARAPMSNGGVGD
jgi:transposase-like protein